MKSKKTSSFDSYALSYDVVIICKDCKFYDADKKLCTYYNMISESSQYCKAGQIYGSTKENKRADTQ